MMTFQVPYASHYLIVKSVDILNVEFFLSYTMV